MVAHVMLLAPRLDLTREAQDALVAALERAAREIPSVRRVQVGRRVRHGQAYENGMAVDYPFAAVFEFDDLAGLQAYLRHPAHADLGNRFYDSLAAALAYDYEMTEVAAVRTWFRDRKV
jgi:hypothetical protein